MANKDVLNSTIDGFKANEAIPNVIVGFDGFIDEIIHLVDERQAVDAYTRIENMKDLAARIDQAAGKSCNIEMVVQQAKLGGNGPIMANALVAQGRKVSYCGALGEQDIHPVFKEFAEKCEQVISFSDPGHTDALEFFDGKIMMGKHSSLANVNWTQLLKKLDVSEITKVVEGCDMIATVNWTMLTQMNTLLEGFLEILKGCESKKQVFVDLTDPKKRTSEDLKGVLDLLTRFQSVATTILGLNEAESRQVAEVLGLEISEDLGLRAKSIRDALSLEMVVVHPVNGASVATEAGYHSITGPFTPTPKLTTGAGDNFNGGFCSGILSGLSPEQALYTGVCTSGFYVRQARSPSKSDLVNFMQQWSDADLGVI